MSEITRKELELENPNPKSLETAIQIVNQFRRGSISPVKTDNKPPETNHPLIENERWKGRYF